MAESIQTCLAEELNLYYMNGKKTENYANRIYKIHHLLHGLDVSFSKYKLRILSRKFRQYEKKMVTWQAHLMFSNKTFSWMTSNELSNLISCPIMTLPCQCGHACTLAYLFVLIDPLQNIGSKFKYFQDGRVSCLQSTLCWKSFGNYELPCVFIFFSENCAVETTVSLPVRREVWCNF